jgi:hypothetical protein
LRDGAVQRLRDNSCPGGRFQNVTRCELLRPLRHVGGIRLEQHRHHGAVINRRNRSCEDSIGRGHGALRRPERTVVAIRFNQWRSVMATFATLRERMVDRQIAARGLDDPALLAAFRAVPREDFISGDFADYAYQDSPLPIESGQTISQPYIVALTIYAAGIRQGGQGARGRSRLRLCRRGHRADRRQGDRRRAAP